MTRNPSGRSATIRWLVPAALVASAAAALAVIVHNVNVGSEAGADAERYAYAPVKPGSLPTLWQAPDFRFTDQNGISVTTSSLAGHVWIADFIFTTCTSVCPLLTAKMRVLERELTEPNLRFVSFSVDPDHDTVDALMRYSKRWSPDERRWILLRTEPKSLSTLSRAMRVAVEATGDAENAIMHTSMFFLVDATGGVRGVYDSNDGSALRRLAKDAKGLLPNASPHDDDASPSGERLFAALSCAACHDDPHLAPSLHGVWGEKVVFEDGTSASVDDDYVRESIVAPALHVVRGYLSLMPSYADALSAAEIDGVVSHVRSLSPAAGTGVAVPSSSSAPQLRERPKAPARSIQPSVSAALPSSAPPAETLPAVAVDPVCGMQVRVSSDTPHGDHAGRAYYFCSESCRSAFTKDPRRYAK